MQNCGSSTLLRVGVWHPLRASQESTFLPDDIYLWKTQTEGGHLASIKANNTKKKARNSLLYSDNVLRRNLWSFKSVFFSHKFIVPAKGRFSL